MPPTPDPLTPEERAAVERCRPRAQTHAEAHMLAALDRLAPKPAAEQKPADVPSGTFTVSERGASRFNAGKGVGTVYVQSSLDQPIEVTFRAKPAPDPDREAREALSAAKQHPQWYGAGLTGRLAALRAHGFRHQSEMNNGHEPPAPPPAAVDVVREALEWAGTNPIRPGYTTVVSDGASTRIVANETLAQYVERGAAALAARGVTFGGKA